ncbi:Arginine-glutamic acid dipeptide repeats protein [Rhizoctonia solani]|uniref:Arginine-glutamic acid dipeptide repeats protein n=1 Tax=Rhizoctonia solani TaxID=456999 RepID=A0A0K6FN86_9AGAM|nr:Arginine-glutamic acid dipeptide repeats protein [Rhizoctonia solani]
MTFRSSSTRLRAWQAEGFVLRNGAMLSLTEILLSTHPSLRERLGRDFRNVASAYRTRCPLRPCDVLDRKFSIPAPGGALNHEFSFTAPVTRFHFPSTIRFVCEVGHQFKVARERRPWPDRKYPCSLICLYARRPRQLSTRSRSLAKEALAAKRANNEKRSYAQVVKTRPQPAGESTFRARVVLEPTLRELTSNDPNGRNAAANPYLEHIAVRDARGPHRTPSPASPPVDHVSPVPEALGSAVPPPAAISSETGPIATTSQGGNAWPGITIGQNVGEVVRSRFAGQGRTTRGPRNVNATIRVAPPLRRTDVDTIVPGTPRPQRPVTHVLSLSQPAPNTHTVAHGPTNNTAGAPTHPQTNLGRVTLSQPLPPPTMSPPGPRVRKPRLPRNGQPASQSNTSSSGPIVTPTPTPSGAMAATSTTRNQVQGNTVCAQTVHTAFNFGAANLSSNASVPIRYKLQATRKPNSQPGRHIPSSMQQPSLSPGPNPFYVPTTRQAPHQSALFDQSARAAPTTLQAPPAPPMADRPMITAQNPAPAHRHAEPSAQLARFDTSAVPPAQSQVIVAQPPLAPTRPSVLLQPQTQAPSYVEYALQRAPVAQYPPAPQPTHAPQFLAPQVAQPQVDYLVAPNFSSQPLAPATQPLQQQQPAGQQAPLGPAPPMEVGGVDGDQDEQAAAAHAVGAGLPGDGPNLPVFRPSTISSYPHEIQPVVKSFVAFFRVWNFATGSYEYKSPNPNDLTPSRDEMALQCWNLANEKHGTVIAFDPEFIKAADAAVCALRSVSKSYLVPAVHHFYGFRVGD